MPEGDLLSCALETAPSCANGVPCTVWPCVAETALVTLSRAKKRKIRDRRVAVKKALISTGDLKSRIPFLQSQIKSAPPSGAHGVALDSSLAPSFEQYFQQILARLENIELSLSGCNEARLEGLQSQPCVSRHLNPDAQEFSPSPRTHAQLATETEAPLHDAKAASKSPAFVSQPAGKRHDSCNKDSDSSWPSAGDSEEKVASDVFPSSHLEGSCEKVPYLPESAIPVLRAVTRHHAAVGNSIVSNPTPSRKVFSSNASTATQLRSPDESHLVSKHGLWLRVQWPATAELSAGDVLDHFNQFGPITDMDWLEVDSNTSMETMKIYFESAASATKAMRAQRPKVKREADGKIISVKIYVQFSDNNQV